MRSIEDIKAAYAAAKKDIISAYEAEQLKIERDRSAAIDAAQRWYEHTIAAIAAEGGEEYKARAAQALAEYEAEVADIDADADAYLAASREALREALEAAEKDCQRTLRALGVE